MGLKPEEKRAIISYRLEKARETYNQVKGVLPLEYWEIIANRMYYAAFYVVSALLIANGYEVHTHNGVIQLFGLHFIKTGIVSTENGKLYSKPFSLRLTGDYSDNYSLTKEDVLPLVEPTGVFINDISTLIATNS